MTQPIVPWSSTPNYPAGGDSWSGTPTKVAPSATYLTPKNPTGLSAQNLNWIFNQLGSIAGQVATGIWMTAAANWNAPSPNVGVQGLPGAIPTCATWDAYFQRWVLAGQIASPGQGQIFITYSPDGGKSWATFPGIVPAALGFFFSVASSPATGSISWRLSADSGAAGVGLWSGGVGTPTYTNQPALAGADMGVCTYWNNAFWFVGSSGVASSSWTGFSATSSSGAGAWSNASGSLPAGWTSLVRRSRTSSRAFSRRSRRRRARGRDVWRHARAGLDLASDDADDERGMGGTSRRRCSGARLSRSAASRTA